MKRSLVVATAGSPAARSAGRVAGVLLAAAMVPAAGCRTDLSQQLLERELRMQEDQIYQLQDELQEKCARLDRIAGENTSLRRQLGFSDADRTPRRRGPTPSAGPIPPRATPAQPLLVPPTIELPGPGVLPPPAAPAAPGTVAPPKLEGIPPLPTEPRFPGTGAAADAGAVRRVSATEPVPAAAPPAGPPLTQEESLAVAGRITHLVVNAARTECFDGDADGTSDGLALVVEPRDGDERLVTAAGDVMVAVFDVAGPSGGTPLARWDIPAQEAIQRFRRTSRNRGLHFVLRWPGPPPAGDHVQVQVVLTTFDAATFATECTVATRPQAPPPATP